jgi:hypothetical protein
MHLLTQLDLRLPVNMARELFGVLLHHRARHWAGIVALEELSMSGSISPRQGAIHGSIADGHAFRRVEYERIPCCESSPKEEQSESTNNCLALT